MIEELIRYRDLAVTLIISVLLSVAAFALFLQIDMQRARTHFGAITSIATSHGETITERLLNFTYAVAANQTDLAKATTSVVESLREDDLLAFVSVICERTGDSTQVLHVTGSQALPANCILEDSFSIPVNAPWWGKNSRVQAVIGRVDNDSLPNSDLIKSGYSPVTLALQLHLGSEQVIVLEVDHYRLLDEFSPRRIKDNAMRGDVCLDLLMEDNYTPIACDTDPTLPGGIGTHASTDEVFRFTTHGLQWQVRSRPSAEDLANQISTTPFLIFGGTGVLCSLICWFVFRSADKSVKLDKKNRELARMLEKLDRQNQDLDQFAVMAAHDLQAPLRFMVSNAHYLDMDIEELDRPDLKKLSGVIIEQGERMRALILDLLAFCRSGQDELKLSPVNVGVLINDEISQLMQNQNYSGSHIVVGNLPATLRCDHEKLAQIIRNLLDNALKFSQDNNNPKVTISASRDEEWAPWLFVVQDNGCGIDAEHRERIFRPFNRLDVSLAGTGVGLAIVKKLVERLHGRIWVEPASDGHGTRFNFTVSDLTEGK